MSGPRIPGGERGAALNAAMIARVRHLLDGGYTGPITLHCKDGRLLRVEYRRIESVEDVLRAARERARKAPAPRPGGGRSRGTTREGSPSEPRDEG